MNQKKNWDQVFLEEKHPFNDFLSMQMTMKIIQKSPFYQCNHPTHRMNSVKQAKNTDFLLKWYKVSLPCNLFALFRYICILFVHFFRSCQFPSHLLPFQRKNKCFTWVLRTDLRRVRQNITSNHTPVQDGRASLLAYWSHRKITHAANVCDRNYCKLRQRSKSYMNRYVL